LLFLPASGAAPGHARCLVHDIHPFRKTTMNHVYPVRHPPVPAASQSGETTSTHDRFANGAVERRGNGAGAAQPDPQLPHEHDESSHSQASSAASHGDVGEQAYGDLMEGRQDTDKGPEMDRLYNEKVAPHRGPKDPRQ
jgi:hypothetical protein